MRRSCGSSTAWRWSNRGWYSCTAGNPEPECQPAGVTCPPTPESVANPDRSRAAVARPHPSRVICALVCEGSGGVRSGLLPAWFAGLSFVLGDRGGYVDGDLDGPGGERRVGA